MPTKNWFKKDALPFKILTQPTSKNVVKWFDDETEGLDDEELILILRARGGINTPTVLFTFVSILSIPLILIICYFRNEWTFKSFYLFIYL